MPTDAATEPGVCKFIRDALKSIPSEAKWVKAKELRDRVVGLLAEGLDARQSADTMLTTELWCGGLRYLSSQGGGFWWLETTLGRNWIVLDPEWLQQKVFGEILKPAKLGGSTSCRLGLDELAGPRYFGVDKNAPKDRQALSDLLQDLGLAFSLPNGEFLIPGKLPEAEQGGLDSFTEKQKDKHRHEYFIGRKLTSLGESDCLLPGFFATLMVRAIACRNDRDMFSRDATQTSFWWADGAAEALVELVDNRRGICIRILGADSSGHVNLMNVITTTIHEIRQDISPAQFGLREWATWKTGVSIKIVDVEANTVRTNIGEHSIPYVNFHGESVPYESLMDGQLDPIIWRKRNTEEHMDHKLDTLEKLEVNLDPHGIEESPLARGGFGSVHRTRSVFLL